MRASLRHPSRRVVPALVAAVTLGLVGCGGTRTTTTTATVRVAAAPVAAVSTADVAPSRAVSATARKRSTTSSRWAACDANIDALRPHTSCPFAQNAFYEYWASGGDSPLQVYSPAVGRSFTTACDDEGFQILCRTEDGGRARFSSEAVAAYDAHQAGAYASTHDTGIDSTSATVGVAGPQTSGDDVEEYDGSASAVESGSSDDLTGEEIENYENGTGYRVQCADGMYSRSGGKQGACSGHGGVG